MDHEEHGRLRGLVRQGSHVSAGSGYEGGIKRSGLHGSEERISKEGEMMNEEIHAMQDKLTEDFFKGLAEINRALLNVAGMVTTVEEDKAE